MISTKNQSQKDSKTRLKSSACKPTPSRSSKCNTLTKTFETILGRLKLNFPGRFYLCCCLSKKVPNHHQKTCLPSKLELEQRCPPPHTPAAVCPVMTRVQRPKVETPYWAVRQRLPKSAVLYEKSKISTSGPQELSPARLVAGLHFNHLAKSPSIKHQNEAAKSYDENGAGLYRKNSTRPKIQIPTSNLKHYSSSEYRDSVSSVDSSYKTLPCSRRTSGYSSAGSEFSAAAQVETVSTCNRLEATPEVNEKVEDVFKKQSSCSTFEERDGYKCLTYKSYNRSFGHEYVNNY